MARAFDRTMTRRKRLFWGFCVGLMCIALLSPALPGLLHPTPKDLRETLTSLPTLAAGIVAVCGLVWLYILPITIARKRHHHQALAITVLTVLLGWTFLGWVVALVWACTVVQEAHYR